MSVYDPQAIDYYRFNYCEEAIKYLWEVYQVELEEKMKFQAACLGAEFDSDEKIHVGYKKEGNKYINDDKALNMLSYIAGAAK